VTLPVLGVMRQEPGGAFVKRNKPAQTVDPLAMCREEAGVAQYHAKFVKDAINLAPA
jgi:hypothetical protein